MIKAIMLDVDGTLVSFETHKVLQSSVEALKEIHDRGVRIVIATGRAAGDLHEIAAVPYDGIIALNGADCVLLDGTVIRRYLIPKDDFKKAMEIAKAFDFAVAIELDEGVFVNRLTPTVERIAKIVEHPIPAVVDIEELFDRKECCQLCFYIDDEMEQQVMPLLPNLSLSRWHPLFADVNLAGISKATGLSAFADYYGIEMAEIMACGDGGNDIPMLKAAGIGVAMGNASETVKASADFVTDTVENDGLCKMCIRDRDGTVIRRYLIPKDDFKKAMEIAKAFDFAVAIELDEGVFVNRLTPTVERIAKIVEHPIPAVVDIEELFDRKECCQLCFYIDDEMEQQVMPLLPNLSLSRWHPLFADVNLAGISKATGLSAFADYYGIEMAEIMACGDGGNDIPMLKAAGIGVAMGNASETVKASADFVTDTVENDGLCKALKHFGII